MRVVMFLFFYAFTLTASNVHADGHGVGNGGDAVVCYTDSSRQTIQSVRMFDHWEQDLVIQIPGGINLGASDLSVQDKIVIATDRIAKFQPSFAEKIKEIALSMANNINFYLVTSYQLPEIDDANPRAIPSEQNCYIEQFAVQYKDLATEMRRFYIASKFYNHSSTTNDDRAGILLHEAIYRNAILSGEVDSDGTRYFNYIISTSKIDELDLTDAGVYLQILNDAKLNKEDEYKNNCKLMTNRGLSIYAQEYKKMFGWVACINQKVTLNSNAYITWPAGYDLIPDRYVSRHDRTYPAEFQGGSKMFFHKKINGSWQSVNFPDEIKLIFSPVGGEVEYYSFYDNYDTNSTSVQNFLSLVGQVTIGGETVTCKSPVVVKATDLKLSHCPVNGQTAFSLNNNLYLFDFIALRNDINDNPFYWVSLSSNSPSKSFFIPGSSLGLAYEFDTNHSILHFEGHRINLALDPNGNVIAGAVSTPFTTLFNGFSGNIKEIYYHIDSNKLIGRVKSLFNPALKNGLPILADGSVHNFLNDFCEEKGFFSYSSIEIKEEYIAGNLNFFSILSGSTVTKTDEYVKRLKQFECSKLGAEIQTY